MSVRQVSSFLCFALLFVVQPLQAQENPSIDRFAGLALDWAVVDTVSLIAQLDLHSAPMDSDLTALGDEAIMVSLGARWRFAQGWTVDFNFVEDARVETAPDITFQASLRYYSL